MTFFRNIFRSIYFVIILFFETLINFLISFDWIVISPFLLLINFVSTKRYDNQNIIPSATNIQNAQNNFGIDPTTSQTQKSTKTKKSTVFNKILPKKVENPSVVVS